MLKIALRDVMRQDLRSVCSAVLWPDQSLSPVLCRAVYKNCLPGVLPIRTKPSATVLGRLGGGCAPDQHDRPADVGNKNPVKTSDAKQQKGIP